MLKIMINYKKPNKMKRLKKIRTKHNKMIQIIIMISLNNKKIKNKMKLSRMMLFKKMRPK